MELIQDLLKYIDDSPTSYHASENARKILLAQGFQELSKEDSWDLKEKGKYFVVNGDSALIAFRIGSLGEDLAFQLIGSHGDSPGFRIKPNAEMLVKDGYIKLNTEVYGGPIYSTWYDRPLSIAGRVIVEEEGRLVSKLLNIEKDLLIIPNLAIHMNREVNNGYKYNAQKDTLPLLAMVEEELEKDNLLLNLLAEELRVNVESILDFDLYLYPREKGCQVGLKGEFLSVSRLDNLSMAYTSLRALIDAKESNKTNFVVIHDHEEIGSSTRAGAASPFLKDTLARVASFAQGEDAYYRALAKGFMISADLTHALHPNYTEAADPTNGPILNKGPAIKVAANRSYSTDAYSSAFFKQVCKKAGVPVQSFTNRSDKRGGSTIGPISLGQLDIAMVDVGNPTLAMHSVRELVGTKDQEYIYKAFLYFFQG